MKKIKALFLMGILGILIAPSIASAASFEYGNPVQNENKTTIPLVLNLEESELNVYDQVGLKCETDYQGLDCSIEQIANGGFYINTSSGSPLIIKVDGRFGETKTTIANLVITNEEDTKKEVKLILSDGKLIQSKASEGEEKAENKIIANYEKQGFKVAAKVEEKVTSSDATLKELKVSEGTMYPEFKPDVNDYIVYGIKDTINKITFTSTCNDGDCKTKAMSEDVTINAPYKTVPLKKGKNIIKYQVTASDGSTKNAYNFTVYLGEDYNSSQLSSISVGEYTLTPEFSKDVLQYTVVVPNKVTSVDELVEYELVDDNAKAEKKLPNTLVVGDNVAKIKVTSMTGEKTEYKVTIVRQKDGKIEVVSYKDGQITFYDSDGISNTVAEAEFKKQYEDEWQKIENKEYEFDEEGNIKKEVEEEPTDTEEEVQEEKKKSNTGLIILLIVIGLVIIGVAGFFIFRKKKPEESEEVIEEEGIEEGLIEEEKETEEKEEETTVDIDEALSDLLSTKKYDFEDDDKE